MKPSRYTPIGVIRIPTRPLRVCSSFNQSSSLHHCIIMINIMINAYTHHTTACLPGSWSWLGHTNSLASQDLHSANTTISDALTSIGAASRQGPRILCGLLYPVACRVGQRSRTGILRCALLRQMAALLHLNFMRHSHSAIPNFAGPLERCSG